MAVFMGSEIPNAVRSANRSVIESRRRVLRAGAGVAVLAVLSSPEPAGATVEATRRSIEAFARGREPRSGRIRLSVPEVAENGNSVPLSVSVESPMRADDHVESILVVAEHNPDPEVATFHFTPASGRAAVSTRIRLAETQTVTALARMNDGSVFVDRAPVRVTIGGCGS